MSLNPPVAALSGRSVCLWTSVAGSEDPPRSMAVAQGEPDFPKCAHSGFPERNGAEVCFRLQSVPPSLLGSLRKDDLVQTGRGHPQLARSYPDSHPGPPKRALRNSTAKLKSEAVFFCYLWAALGVVGRWQIYYNFIAGHQAAGTCKCRDSGAGGAMSHSLSLCPISRQ